MHFGLFPQSEAAVGAPQSVAPSSVEDEQVASSIEAPCSPAIEKDSPIAPPSPHTESEGAVVKSTGEMECSESPDAPHSEVVYAEVCTCFIDVHVMFIYLHGCITADSDSLKVK